MNRLNYHLSPKIEADIQKLVEPLASYITAIDQPNIALVLALILLLENLREINVAANHYLASISENHVG